MQYNNRVNKNIEKLNKLLHEQAANAPVSDPFTPVGSREWAEWSEGCREIEGALREAGEDF